MEKKLFLTLGLLMLPFSGSYAQTEANVDAFSSPSRSVALSDETVDYKLMVLSEGELEQVTGETQKIAKGVYDCFRNEPCREVVEDIVDDIEEVREKVRDAVDKVKSWFSL